MTRAENIVVPQGWWRTTAAYVLAVTAALALGEAGVRVSGFEPPQWYPQIIGKLGDRPVRFLFVGSSRVGVGVNVVGFAEAQPPGPDGTHGPVYNNGHGFAGLAAHALGLRRMADAGLLRDALVFVEAAGGTPEQTAWRDRWFYREAPSFLVSVAGPRDLPGLWRSSMSVDEKIGGSVRTLLNGSWLAAYAEMARVNGLGGAYRQAARLRGALTGAVPEEAPRFDLPEHGGVRGDVDDRARIGRAATDEGRRMLAEQRAFEDWDGTIAGDIVRIVRAGGGEVVFFEMPLSPPMRLAALTDVGRRNAAAFVAWASANGIRVLRTTREFGPEAFPDAWHMSATAADVFTRDLIEEWARQDSNLELTGYEPAVLTN